MRRGGGRVLGFRLARNRIVAEEALMLCRCGAAQDYEGGNG
jgi:hypothetical protein